jgi:hypothetical protein
MATASDVRRINRGKGHSYQIAGEPAMGVTTVIKKGIPAPALVGWAGRMVAEAVVSRRSLLTEMTDAEVLDFLRGAPYRDRDEAAAKGTEVHRLAALLAAGEEVDVPETLVGHVDSYLDFLEVFKPMEAVLERPVFNRHYRYGGTMDLLCKLEIAGVVRQALLDIKTTRSGPFGETALQLAAYGKAEFYVDEAGDEIPMPAIDFYGVIWVRADAFDLYPYDVTEVEFKQFLHSMHTAWWCDNRMETVRQDAIWQRQEVKAS